MYVFNLLYLYYLIFDVFVILHNITNSSYTVAKTSIGVKSVISITGYYLDVSIQ